MDFNGFTKDIINGEAADVILIPPEQIEKVKNLSSKGVLEDLTSYLAVDEELSVSDFIPNILETMKTGNGLYGISPKFTLKSIVVNVSDIGTDIVWTPEGMMKLMENSDKPLIAGNEFIQEKKCTTISVLGEFVLMRCSRK